MSDENKLSRRDFIKDAAIGAAVVAGASALSTTTAQAQAPDKWDKQVDVIVVGSGCAGFPAAITAAEKGASVAILEKLPTIGGNSLASGGNYGAFGTAICAEEAKKDPEHFSGDSVDMYYEDKLALGGYLNDPAVVRVFAENCNAGYEWMRKLGYTQSGVDYEEGENCEAPDNEKGMHFTTAWNSYFENGKWFGPFRKGRHHTGGKYKTYSSGEAGIMAMKDRAVALGVQILTEMQVTAIIRKGGLSGEVLGVKVTDLKNKKDLTFRATRGVVLAAGGWHANAAMCKRYDPRLTTESVNSGSAENGRCQTAQAPGRGTTGEVLMATMDIGADVALLGMVQLRMGRSAVAYTGPYSGQLVGQEAAGEFIDVDGQGKRFWMESGQDTHRSAQLTDLYVKKVRTVLGEHRWWGIFDSAVISEVKDATIKFHLDNKMAYRGNTIEELAKAIQVPPENLAATVKRWNEMVTKGADTDFGVNKSKLKHKIEKAPFYAVPKMYYRHHSLGGVRITPKAEVLDRQNKPIPRLYAAGEFTGNLHGIERDGGCSWTDGVVFGIVAGTNVAAEKPLT